MNPLYRLAKEAILAVAAVDSTAMAVVNITHQ